MSIRIEPRAPQTPPESCEDQPREELCGEHIGDRRVRVPRQQRTTIRKIIAVVRRTLSR